MVIVFSNSVKDWVIWFSNRYLESSRTICHTKGQKPQDRICMTRSLSAKGERREDTSPSLSSWKWLCGLSLPSRCLVQSETGSWDPRGHPCQAAWPQDAFCPKCGPDFSNTSKALSSSTTSVCSVRWLMQNKCLCYKLSISWKHLKVLK